MEKKSVYPVSTSSFKRIREEGYVYIDKTFFIHRMLHQEKGVFYFLARPRRFGKSLYLDTLEQYFRGKKDLFRGLDIDRLQSGEWETYPVLHLDLTGISFDSDESLNECLGAQIISWEKEYEVKTSEGTPPIRFYNLIHNLSAKKGKRLVILVDEYDAPLTSSIDRPELQEIYREQLHGFYSVLKKCDNLIKFCMLTGVTRYGKVSVFSGLNNLNDITFVNEYSSICGITKEELEKYYSEGIEKLARKEGLTIEETYGLLKFHYDGYHFSDSLVDIYNPFSLNHALNYSSIKDYWCESGVPTILSKSLMQNDYDVEKLNGKKVQENDLKDLSMYVYNPVPLFYQTGYLTLKAYDPKRKRYTIGYPNREVESGILQNILNYYTCAKENSRNAIFDLEDSLEEGDPDTFIRILKSFLSAVPSSLREDVAQYENYYHTIFYCIFKLIGLDIHSEYNTSEGYIDILIKTERYIYVIELKVNGNAEDALKQIEEKHYCDPFLSNSRRIIRIGLGFSKKTHTIDSFLISGI